jgi:hypothetical protein
VLECARHKSKRDVELLVATLSPRPDVPSRVRKLPTPAPPKLPAPEPNDVAKPDDSTSVDMLPSVRMASRPAEVKPIAPERYKIQFTVSRETFEKLRRTQDLLRHSVPNGDPVIIFERALALLVADLERIRIARTAHPRAARSVSPNHAIFRPR